MKKHNTNIYWSESRLKAKLYHRGLWKKRNKFAHLLERNGFDVHEFDNCWRLHLYKSDEQFIIDCQQDNTFHTSLTPVKWVDGHTDKPVIITDIPSSGRYGIWNEDSKFTGWINAKMMEVYGYTSRLRG